MSEANGKILSYNVSCSSNEETRSLSEILDPQHRAEIRLDRHNYIISVVARNSAGSSPPSKIASTEIPNGERLGELMGADGNGTVGVACSLSVPAFLMEPAPPMLFAFFMHMEDQVRECLPLTERYSQQ